MENNITSLHYVMLCFSHLHCQRHRTQRNKHERSGAVSVVGISAERKSSLPIRDQFVYTVSYQEVRRPERDFERGLSLPCLCPQPFCLASSMTPRYRFQSISGTLGRDTCLRILYLSLGHCSLMRSSDCSDGRVVL